MPDRYRIVPLAGQDRSRFTSGSAPLDGYFRSHVTQDVKRRITNCFVALNEKDDICAFYTLASAQIPVSELPDDLRRKLPRYPNLPAALIGRLAVDQRSQRSGLGEALVADAAMRAGNAAPAVFTMLVEAKDDRAEAFYRRLGFVSLASRSGTLFLPIAVAQRARALRDERDPEGTT